MEAAFGLEALFEQDLGVLAVQELYAELEVDQVDARVVQSAAENNGFALRG